MSTIEIIYLCSGSASLAAMVPQVVRLVKLKHSEEHSLFMWVAWTCGQTISLIYAIVVEAYAYAAISIAWISLYIIMVTLIMRYGKRPVIVLPLDSFNTLVAKLDVAAKQEIYTNIARLNRHKVFKKTDELPK